MKTFWISLSVVAALAVGGLGAAQAAVHPSSATTQCSPGGCGGCGGNACATCGQCG